MGRTPRVVGNAKRTGQFVGDGGLNDIAEEFDEETFWAVAGEAIAVGEILCRTHSGAAPNFRNVSRAFGNAGTGFLQIVCGVALTAAPLGEKVRVLRRGVHPAVVLSVLGGAGATGNAIVLDSGTPGQGASISPLTGTTPAHTTVGIQIEAGTGAGPFTASVYVSTYF